MMIKNFPKQQCGSKKSTPLRMMLALEVNDWKKSGWVISYIHSDSN